MAVLPAVLAASAPAAAVTMVAVLAGPRPTGAAAVRWGRWSALRTGRRTGLITAAGLAGAVVALAVMGLPVVGLAAVVGAGLGAWIVRDARRSRRRRALRLDLVDAIELLVQLLPTGQGLRQSLEVLAARGPRRLRGDARQLVDRAREAPFEVAVREFEARLADPLASLLAVALIVGNRSGGQLVPLFQELGRASRAVELVRGQVEAEQAQGRYGAGVICCMPPAVLAVLHVVNPEYLAPYATATGQVVLGGIATLMLLGYIWMRRILRLPEPDRLPLRRTAAETGPPERPRGRASSRSRRPAGAPPASTAPSGARRGAAPALPRLASAGGAAWRLRGPVPPTTLVRRGAGDLPPPPPPPPHGNDP